MANRFNRYDSLALVYSLLLCIAATPVCTDPTEPHVVKYPWYNFSLGVVLQLLWLLLLLVLPPLLLLLLLDDAAASAAALLRFCARRASGGVVLQARCCCDVALVLRPSCITFTHTRYQYSSTHNNAGHLYCKLEYVPKHQYPSPKTPKPADQWSTPLIIFCRGAR